MQIGILTGGGDCPGLNAVIRAVTRKSLDAGHDVIGVQHGWRGLVEGQTRALGSRDIAGILPRGGTILKTSRTNPFEIEGGCRSRAGEPRKPRRAGGDRRRGHPRGGSPAARRVRRSGGGSAQDDRQRPVGHRLHLRVRHRAGDRDRGHRPAALHRRVARPGDGVRGDGPSHRVDRGHERHRRRRRRDPDPRDPDHGGTLLPADRAPSRQGQGFLDRGGQRGVWR